MISSHMEALTKIPKVASTSKVKWLRSLYEPVESHVRGLEYIEISSEMYGCFLTPIIMQKLPEEFRIAKQLTLCDATVYIQAYVAPVICGPLTQQSTELTQSCYEHHLSLADRAGGGVLAIQHSHWG